MNIQPDIEARIIIIGCQCILNRRTAQPYFKKQAKEILAKYERIHARYRELDLIQMKLRLGPMPRKRVERELIAFTHKDILQKVLI